MLLHQHLKLVVTTLYRTLRIRSMHTAQTIRAFRSRKIKSRIIFQIGLCDTDFHSIARIYYQRQEHQALFIQLRQFVRCIRILERIKKLGVIITVFTAFYIRHGGSHIRWKTIIRYFRHHTKRLLPLIHKTVGDTVIVCTKLYIPVFFETQGQSIIMISQFAGTVERRWYHLVHTLSGSSG